MDILSFIVGHQMAIQMIVATVVSLIVGGVTGKTLLAAACRIVAIVAKEALDNESKRELAIKMLYDEFPTVGRMIPKALMADIVESAWANVVKDLIQKATEEQK